ncbi:transposase [Luteimonas sp. SX5]|uniref:Transposase n=1 Tax=Luteimonas galliterrae TaxID=2940486 RepID=A0ABT0MI50_9GAMM|nr:transposase [Luteimonas galliterrae]MCL1634548.1 transposase [Luteimonas galliterrae]
MAAGVARLDAPPGMPRYRRYFAPGQTVFLTLVCHERQPLLRSEAAKRLILDALRDQRLRHPFKHHAHVLLDDHLHLLLSPAEQVTVPRLVGGFKLAVLARWPGACRLWQRRYYDHIIRDADDFARHLDYIHFNPVKHGLVAHAGAWQWSSLAAWRARGAYGSDW